jgi:hypothetical protein
MVALLGSVLVVAACDRSDALCDLVCECEHCNDVRSKHECASGDRDQDFAAAYGCADEWDAYADCVEDNGRCEDRQASFTTRVSGSCSLPQSIPTGCTRDADCQPYTPNATCAGGSCTYLTCADGGGFCSDDSDCPNGEDLCRVTHIDLLTCVADGNGDPTLLLQQPFGD